MHTVVDAKANAVGVAEVELRQIALQVRLLHVVERADDPALEDRKEVFSRIGAIEPVADVFTFVVVDAVVAGELSAGLHVERSASRHQGRGAVHSGHDQRADRLGVDVGNVERAGATVTLNEGHDGLLCA